MAEIASVRSRRLVASLSMNRTPIPQQHESEKNSPADGNADEGKAVGVIHEALLPNLARCC